MAKAGLRRSGALRSYSETTGVSFLGVSRRAEKRAEKEAGCIGTGYGLGQSAFGSGWTIAID